MQLEENNEEIGGREYRRKKISQLLQTIYLDSILRFF